MNAVNLFETVQAKGHLDKNATLPVDETPKQQPKCGNCGSNQVVRDTSVYWDVELQDWVINTIYDKGMACGDCGQEISSFEMVEITT